MFISKSSKDIEKILNVKNNIYHGIIAGFIAAILSSLLCIFITYLAYANTDLKRYYFYYFILVPISVGEVVRLIGRGSKKIFRIIAYIISLLGLFWTNFISIIIISSNFNELNFYFLLRLHTFNEFIEMIKNDPIIVFILPIYSLLAYYIAILVENNKLKSK